MPTAVSLQYARALADIVIGPPAADRKIDPHRIQAQLKEVNTLLDENAELRILFSTPAVAAAKKKAVLEELAAPLGLDSVTHNFLNVVIDHDRMALLGEIAEAFEALLDERLGVAVAEITTAKVLAEEKKKELEAALRVLTGREVRVSFSLDLALIGGIQARIGGTIYDGSVRGQLERIRTELAG